MNQVTNVPKIAFLVANGFLETDLVEISQALEDGGANCRIVGSDDGLMSAWNGQDWGMKVASDKALPDALALDFSGLVILSGKRSIEKLKLCNDTRRFVGCFLRTGKPVAACGEALEVLAHFGLVLGYNVAGPIGAGALAKREGGVWVDAPFMRDKNLLTGLCRDDVRSSFIQETKSLMLKTVKAKELVAA